MKKQNFLLTLLTFTFTAEAVHLRPLNRALRVVKRAFIHSSARAATCPYLEEFNQIKQKKEKELEEILDRYEKVYLSIETECLKTNPIQSQVVLDVLRKNTNFLKAHFTSDFQKDIDLQRKILLKKHQLKLSWK